MNESLQPLLLAIATFVISHFVLSSLPVRRAIFGVIGESGFRILYTVVALFTLIWAAREFGAAPHVEVWGQTEILRNIAAAIMPFACILAIAGVSTRNVTSVGCFACTPEHFQLTAAHVALSRALSSLVPPSGPMLPPVCRVRCSVSVHSSRLAIWSN